MAAELSRQLRQPLPDSLVRDDSTCCETDFGLKLCRKRGIRGKIKIQLVRQGTMTAM